MKKPSMTVMRGLVFLVLTLPLPPGQVPSGVLGEPQQHAPWQPPQQDKNQAQQHQPQQQQQLSQDLLDKQHEPNLMSNKNPNHQSQPNQPSQSATTRIPNQSKAFERQPASQNKTEDGLMDKMKSLASQGKEKLIVEGKDSHTVYKNPESVGMSSRKPEIFEQMAKSAALGRKAAHENHGSNGTDASFVQANEIGAVERVQQILLKIQEQLRNNAQKFDEKLLEYRKKILDSIFGSSS